MDRFELLQKERRAEFDLLRVGGAVLRRAAFHHIADVDVSPVKSQGKDHLIQELSRPSHKGPPLPVFVETGSLAHENQRRFGRALSENEMVAVRAKAASPAIPELLTDCSQSLLCVLLWRQNCDYGRNQDGRNGALYPVSLQRGRVLGGKRKFRFLITDLGRGYARRFAIITVRKRWSNLRRTNPVLHSAQAQAG
jgi:hypothetical protein